MSFVSFLAHENKSNTSTQIRNASFTVTGMHLPFYKISFTLFYFYHHIFSHLLWFLFFTLVENVHSNYIINVVVMIIVEVMYFGNYGVLLSASTYSTFPF